MFGFCEHDNEHSVYMKRDKILGCVRKCQLLQKWNWLVDLFIYWLID
jgi:hypothetical protein